MMKNFYIHFNRIQRMVPESVEKTKAVEDHIDILLSIRKNQPEKAHRIMQLHLNRYAIDVNEASRKYPQYF